MCQVDVTSREWRQTSAARFTGSVPTTVSPGPTTRPSNPGGLPVLSFRSARLSTDTQATAPACRVTL